MEKIVAIHQPNYLPWIGYFYKIAHCNIFVFLDDVQYSKNSYQNRVQISANAVPLWLTQPVITRGNFKTLTNKIQFVNSNWMQKHRKTLIQFYKKHPYFKEIESLLEIYDEQISSLSEFNIKIIRLISRLLKIDNGFVLSSHLNVSEIETENATERLINIIKRVKGTTYLSGSGGRKYHNENMFQKAAINLKYSDFLIRDYKQIGSNNFIAGLSIVDVICNIGCTETSLIIKGS